MIIFTNNRDTGAVWLWPYLELAFYFLLIIVSCLLFNVKRLFYIALFISFIKLSPITFKGIWLQLLNTWLNVGNIEMIVKAQLRVLKSKNELKQFSIFEFLLNMW